MPDIPLDSIVPKGAGAEQKSLAPQSLIPTEDDNPPLDDSVLTSATIPGGGQFSAQQAQVVAAAWAWLDALEYAASQLALLDTVRMAGLDGLQRQALAAQLSLATKPETVWTEVNPKSSAHRSTEIWLPEQAEKTPPSSARESQTEAEQAKPASAARPNPPWPEGQATASVRVLRPDATALSRALADVTPRERLEECIVALRRLVPEAQEWAERGRSLRAVSRQENKGQGAQPDDVVATRLSLLSSSIEAILRYVGFLKGDPMNPALEKALALASYTQAPLQVAWAQLLLRQDRPQAALEALRDWHMPESPSLEKKRWIESRNPTWGQAWSAVWGPHASEKRVYARGLYVRALARLRSGQAALAESDMNAALDVDGQDAEFWLTRGAARQLREDFEAMCQDYYQACRLGLCDGLASARATGRCLPPE